MIGILAAAAIALLPAGNYVAPISGGGASCGATTVPVLELGSVVCEAPSQILAQPATFAPVVGFGYAGNLSPWAAGFGGSWGGPFGGPFGGGGGFGGHWGGHWGGHGGHCTTSTTGGVTTRTCS